MSGIATRMARKGMNRNVVFANFFSFLDGVGMGMWSYAILGPYLYELTGSNQWAGYAEGIQGALQVLASLPSGYFADKMRRDTILKLTSVIGVLGVALTMVGIFWRSPFAAPAEVGDKPMSTWWAQYCWLTVGMGIFGLYMGAWTPPMHAIYADSIPTGQRSYYETIRYTISIASLGTGPLTNVVLFYFLEDTWGIKQMSVIFAMGMLLHLVSFYALFLFNDDLTLHASEAAGYHSISTRDEAPPAVAALSASLLPPASNRSGDEGRVEREEGVGSTCSERDSLLASSPSHQRLGTPPSPRMNMKPSPEIASSASKMDSNDSDDDEEDDTLILLRIKNAEDHKSSLFLIRHLHVWMIPYIISLSDILFGMASGMSIKFFPVYFSAKLRLSPISVNLLYLIDPLVEIGFSFWAQRLSTVFGRVEITLLFKCVGIFLLFIIAFCDDLWPLYPYTLCALFVVRSSAINSIFPLSRSILMDYTPSDQRARWSSLESISGFGWSGSAVLGGILVDKYGFDISFHTTAFVQVIALLPYFFLLFLVPKESHIATKAEDLKIAATAPGKVRRNSATTQV